jgi:hypothetical protein
MRLARPRDANVERYILRAVKQEPGELGTQVDRVVTDTQLTTLQFPPGSYYVPMAQPMARIGALMIEPESQGSMIASRLVKAGAPLTTGVELPIWRVMTPADFSGPLVEGQ